MYTYTNTLRQQQLFLSHSACRETSYVEHWTWHALKLHSVADPAAAQQHPSLHVSGGFGISFGKIVGLVWRDDANTIRMLRIAKV